MMKIHRETLTYSEDLRGYLVYDATIPGKRPGIIVMHAWKGQDDVARKKADTLAEMGYVAFCADLYGHGIQVETNEEAEQLMLPLFLDRQKLRDRVVAAFDTLAKHEVTETEKIGAIGFCFGGLTVIELLRSGVPLRGAVSFHGILGNSLGDLQAKTVPVGSNIQGSLLILHGHDDPLVSRTDISAIQKELTDQGVDWQMHIYGHTAHAFTNPIANDPNNGLIYDPRSERRSWQAMLYFFEEIFD